MSKLFLHFLNISITAGWIVLIVVLLRFVLKKAPKWTRVLLWGLVALRLLLPVSIESVTSLVPSAATVSVEPVTQPSETQSSPVVSERIVIETGIPAVNRVVNPPAETAVKSADTVATLKTVAGWVWLAGVIGMLLYAAISYLVLRHRVRASLRVEKGVYVCDGIRDPFILGLLFPKIYLPSCTDETTRGYVLSHERAHLRRFDHIWKPLGFLLLSVYWFNPLLWLAYILLCRDIELACDEKVVKDLDDAGKAAYSEVLLAVSVSRRSIAACPLAFGETGVKGRVKSVLNYKKPAFWIILVAILACIAIAVCFLTVPKKQKGTYVGTWEFSKLIEEGQEFDAAFLAMFGMDKDTIVLNADGTGKRILVTGSETEEWPATYTADGNELTIEFTMSGKYEYRTTETAVYDPKNDTLSLVSEYETYVYTRAGSEQPVSGDSLTFDRLVGVWRTDGIKLSPDDPGLLSGTLAFRSDGSASLDLSTNGRPMQEECTFTLNGNTIELISGGQSSPVSYDPAHDTLSLPIMNVGILTFTRTDEPMPSAPASPVSDTAVTEWANKRKENTFDSFPNVLFRWTSGSVEAVENSKARTLFTGTPIWNVYFADLTGDGKPELCATVSFGPGIVDEHIIVYDYANKQSYVLWDHGTFDYHLYTVDGALYVGKTPYMVDKQVDYGTIEMHDGVLSCRWQSDGSYTALLPELHESELIGEWLVEEEKDNDGNVLYTNDLTLWKEYNFRADGTVVYNETVPVSSIYEEAFGHPVEYPYEVYDGYVYIAGDDTSGAFRWGYYDRETHRLTLSCNTAERTVNQTLKRMGFDTTQTLEDKILGVYPCTGAKVGGKDAAIPTEYVGMKIDLGDSFGLPDVSWENEYYHIATVTIGGEEKTGYDWRVDANNVLTIWNDETGDTWTLQWIEEYESLLLTLNSTDASGEPIVLIFG